jgi:hypothetical protein
VKLVAFAAGLLVVVGTAGSVLRTLVLPRGVTSRISVVVGRVLSRGVFLALARRFDAYETKDRILAFSAPVSLLVVLVTWLFLFLVGYGLILWSVVDTSLPRALRESGSSTFTLGFTATFAPAATVIDLLASATGLIVLALVIAYLPVLYAAFNRRETLVTTLQSRAGSPAWGPEILARHQLVNITDSLPDFYSDWERWAADVAESHANYPVLVWFRSPHPLRSWVLGLLAVLDSAAMYLALSPDRAPSQARLCLRMGFTCLRDIAGALGLPFDPDPWPDEPIELGFDDFQRGVERLAVVGFPMERSTEEAWPHFRGWRVNYESIAYRLADQVVAPPGPWSGGRTQLPGMAISPQRPANRTPEDPRDEGRRKGHLGF